MKANRFTEEQIVRVLKEIETRGKKATQQQREMEINAVTWYMYIWLPPSPGFKTTHLL